VYVAAAAESKVGVFARNATTGQLTFVEVQEDGVAGVSGLFGPGTVRLSPDGLHAYVPAIAGDSIAVFSRNTSTGQLTFVEAELDGVGGVDGLDSARDAALSPDGEHVYVAGNDDSAIAVFSRDEMTGALTFVEVQKNGVGGVSGIVSIVSVTVSSDGKHLYAASVGSDTVTLFTRDAGTGALTFVTTYQDGVGGIDGLLDASWVAVSPDGTRVYAVSRTDDAVVTFARDATTGLLTFLGFRRDGANGVETLDDAQTVAVSPDGAHVYTTSVGDFAVSTFRPLTVRCSAAPAAGCAGPLLPSRAAFVLKERTPDTRDALRWKWRGTTTLADFGDPVGTLNDYAFCVYDPGATLVQQVVIPAGGVCDESPCWRTATTGFKYRDRERTPEGVLRMALKQRTTGPGRLMVRARGEHLPALPPLPLALPATVQVQSAGGPCWEATYTAAGVVTNSATDFKGTPGP
jgi:6-phosphogluconolactonase (cycloisomerase 2 family)